MLRAVKSSSEHHEKGKSFAFLEKERLERRERWGGKTGSSRKFPFRRMVKKNDLFQILQGKKTD